MSLQPRGTTKALSALLTGVLLAVSVLVPMLDGESASRTPALETEHHAATCVTGHDHTICTQVGANLWAGTSEGLTLAHRPRPRLTTPAPSLDLPAFEARTSVRSRAPPLG